MVRRGQRIGLLYSKLNPWMSPTPEQQVTTHSLLLSYSYKWKTYSQIALFAGPQYSLLSAKSVSASGLSPTPSGVRQDIFGYAIGATLSIGITKQNIFQLMASHRVADGAGLSGAVVQNVGQLNLSRRFNEHLSVYGGSFYSESQALGNLPVAAPNAWGAFSRAAFNLTPRSSIAVEYDYSHYGSLSAFLAPHFYHQRVWIEYHYSFGTSPERR